MSKILYACFKTPGETTISNRDVELLSLRLQPDNILFHPPKIIRKEGEIIAIFNPNESTKIRGTSICLGSMINPNSNWWIPLETIPEGTFALYRSNKKHVEVITDFIASRTIWYYYDDNVFISSTSQRAIIFCLKSFKFNQSTIPWLLATGSIGPDQSWDSRVKILNGSSSIVLNRSSWDINVDTQSCVFSPLYQPETKHREELRHALNDTFEFLNLDYSKWVLPLSGGYDSRGILCLLKNTVSELKCVTWGLERSQFEKDNDAYIAKKLADYFNVAHTFYITDISDEPIGKLFNRFFICGEGRIDHVSGYMDGFKIWKQLFEEGTHGIIRGDEGFGWLPVSSELDVRLSIGIPLLSDFVNLKNIQKMGICEQNTPNWLNKKDGESMSSWRDRLYHQFRIPYILAALNDLKLPYTELINPLLTKRILSVVRGLPDSLRTDKILFKRIVEEISPALRFARYAAIDNPGNILRQKSIVSEISHELHSDLCKMLLPGELINYLLEHMETNELSTNRQSKPLKTLLKRMIPARIKSIRRNTLARPIMDINVLAFRCYMICVTYRMFNCDSKIIK